jgi:superfamily II DNA or RNA helicase
MRLGWKTAARGVTVRSFAQSTGVMSGPGSEAAFALRLEFDRGTLVLRGGSLGAEAAALPGMRWDERVGCHRAPARFHAAILERFGACRNVLDDVAVAPLPRLPRLSLPALRPYQAAALDAWVLGGRRGVVVLPTGSGKTRVAVAAVAVAEVGRATLCLVATRILLAQWRTMLAELLGIRIGVFGDGERDVCAVTVATFESAWRHMGEIGNRFELLVVDEAHHFGAGVRDEALEMCTAPRRLGLTATPPEGGALAGLEELVGPVLFELGIADLTGSFLAELELIELGLGLSARERAEYEDVWGAFRAAFDRFRDLAPMGSWSDFLAWAGRSAPGRAAVEGWRRARGLLALTDAKSAAVESLLARHHHSRVLVFTSTKDAAYRIAREHLVMPITADVRSAERDAALAAFRAGRIRALVSSRVLNEGFDVPDADVGIVVGGGLGEREHVQRIGRLLRPAEGKRALVCELVTRGTAEVDASRRQRRGIRPRRPDAL